MCCDDQLNRQPIADIGIVNRFPSKTLDMFKSGDDHRRMRAEHRTQVRRILEYKIATAKRELEQRRAALYGDHSAKGCLQSGGTVRAVIRFMEEIGATFVTDSIEQVSAVAQDVEAFAALNAGFEDLWNFLAAELQSTLNLAGGRHPTDDQSDSVSRAATLLFDKSRRLGPRLITTT